MPVSLLFIFKNEKSVFARVLFTDLGGSSDCLRDKFDVFMEFHTFRVGGLFDGFSTFVQES